MENLLYIFLGLALLVFGGNWLLKASVSLSLRLNISKVVIGMTVVSFATSAPELIVSIKSALNGATGLSIGNVIGSNIANIGLVLGITIILSTINVEKGFYKLDWPAMVFASGLLYLFTFDDYEIERYEGIILFSCLVIFLIYLLNNSNSEKDLEIDEDIPNISLPVTKILFYLIIGGIGLWIGSELLISGATTLAKDFGVSDAVIGVTVVSVGTSIPELAASLIAVYKKEKGISLGNLIGSNIFNILAVLGVTSMITPIKVAKQDYSLLTNDIYWMICFALILLPLALLPKYMKFGWAEGVLLLIAYILFVIQTII